jgi:cytohesin
MIISKIKIFFLLVFITYFNLVLSGEQSFNSNHNFKKDALIWEATTQGNIKLLEKLLKKNLNPNILDNKGYTPLFTSALMGNEQMLIALLKAGANPNAIAKDGTTPLYWGKISCKRNILINLLKYGAILSPQKNSPFKSAFLNNINKLKQYPNKNINEHCLGWNLLHWAIAGNSIESIIFLLENGININSKTKDLIEETPLHIAVEYSNQEAVKLLCEKKADINSFTLSRMTPLHVAIFTKNILIIKLLLQNGANPNIKDISGYTPLYYANRLKDNQIIKLLQSQLIRLAPVPEK